MTIKATYRDLGSLLVLGDRGERIDVRRLAKLECAWRDCRKQSAALIRVGPKRWSTRCKEHEAAHED